MTLTTDPNDPGLGQTRADGQNASYLVLSEKERQKGFVRPLRTSYTHVGARPTHPLRDLTFEESANYASLGYVKFEQYPDEDETHVLGRYWTAAQLSSGCGAVTSMNPILAETYACNPQFYGATFCSRCRTHFPVEQFTWDGTDERVGS